MDFYERFQRSYKKFKNGLKNRNFSDEIDSTSSQNNKNKIPRKLVLSVLFILLAGNIIGIIISNVFGENPSNLGTIVYSEEERTLQPNSIYFFSHHLNASKSSISFKTNINVEFLIVDFDVNENVSLSDLKPYALYGDNDARGFSRKFNTKANYTLVIKTHEEKETEFSCSFKEFSIEEQEEESFYWVGIWFIICSFLPFGIVLVLKLLIPWSQTKSDVLSTLIFHEIKLNFKQWIQKLWILVVIFLSFSNLISTPGVSAISSILFIFVFFGTIIAAVPASSTISGELQGIADSLLSKSVKRWQYILSKFISQYAVILIIYFCTFLSIIGIRMGLKQFPATLDYEQLFLGLGLIAVALTIFNSFGILFSSIFSKPLISIIGSLVIWFFFIFMIQSNSNWNFNYSPVIILQNFDKILLNLWDIKYWRLYLVYFAIDFLCLGSTMLVFYRKDL
ncbi:ABC transporter permease [Candidatus Lokiarchaeum ossiferum]|uniref:ABC transporter permease n=1 Tax=Candidatus Lokiarchaeum ossiferum TaxID=2951803 RepID=UPI00352EE425